MMKIFCDKKWFWDNDDNIHPKTTQYLTKALLGLNPYVSCVEIKSHHECLEHWQKA